MIIDEELGSFQRRDSPWLGLLHVGSHADPPKREAAVPASVHGRLQVLPLTLCPALVLAIYNPCKIFYACSRDTFREVQTTENSKFMRCRYISPQERHDLRG